MFHNITEPMLNRMQHLEALGARENKLRTLLPIYHGFARLVRKDRARGIVSAIPGIAPQTGLHQIPPEAGRFIALLAASAPHGNFLEIGTSAGYSALWLALACRQRGSKLVTFEILDTKIELACETFRSAGVEDVVEIIQGDVRDYLQNYDQIAFCFLDAAKEVYLDCYEAIIPRLVHGGLLVADNMLSHRYDLQPMLDRVMKDESVDATVVPIGTGILVCRKAEHPVH